MTKKALTAKVVELSATLPILRDSDRQWMNDEFKHRWGNKGICYFVILERCKDMQVIRWYNKSKCKQFEFMQQWFTDKGDSVVLARTRFMSVDGWKEDSEMRPSKFNQYVQYSYLGDMRDLYYSGLKIRSLIPALRRNGLRTSLHFCSRPFRLVESLHKSPRIETLWKAGQYQLVNYFYFHNTLDDSTWQSIRIALRHGYVFTSYVMIKDWCDMLNDLTYLGKDTKNPAIICPDDLREAHLRYNRLAERKRYYENYKREIAKVKEYEPIFLATREQFFDMILSDGEITIKVIPTAQEIKEEGLHMHHCVGGYYNKKDSLILSAKIDGKRIETIEVSLREYRLIQSRGVSNSSTPYHDRIVKLINDNLDIIRVLDVNHKSIEKKQLKQLKSA